jgi:RNA polymerase sigma-70 factor, ECF subfamily
VPRQRRAATHFGVTLSTLVTTNFPPSPALDRATPESARLSFAEIAVLAWRALKRLGVPEGALPDAVQEVLLVVHRRRADFAGQSTFRTWVFGIVMRVASTQRRSLRRARAVFSEDEASDDLVGSGEPSPFERLERAQASELLHRLLSELGDEERDALVLIDLEELSVEEAAESLGISESTCRSHIRRARRAFNAKVARERAKRDWRTP